MTKKATARKKLGRIVAEGRKLRLVAHRKTQKKTEVPQVNKFVSYLAAIGKAVLQGLGVLPQVVQAVESSGGQPVPVLDKLSQIGNLALLVEGVAEKLVGPGAGVKKAEAIAPYVAQIVMSSELVAGKTIDPSQMQNFQDACTRLASDVADILNCLKPNVATVSTQSLPAPASPVAVIAQAPPAPAQTVTTARPVAAPAPPVAAPLPALTPVIAAEIPEAPATAAAIASGLELLPQD